MKIKYLIAGIFAVGLVGLSQAQDEASARANSNTNNSTTNSNGNAAVTPAEIKISEAAESKLEKNSDIQTLRMKEALDLDEEQFLEVREINMAYAEDVYRASSECNNNDLGDEFSYIDATRDNRLKTALTKKQYKDYLKHRDAYGFNNENFRADCLNLDNGISFSNGKINTESDYDTSRLGVAIVWIRPEYADMPLPDPGVLTGNICTLSSINAVPAPAAGQDYTYTEKNRKIELKGNGDKFKEKKDKLKYKTKGEKEKVKTNNPKNPKDLKVKAKDKYKEQQSY